MADNRLAFWSNVIGLAASVATLIAFGTGSLTLTGDKFWNSPMFVSVFSLVGVVLLTASLDYLVLDRISQRMVTAKKVLSGPPVALFVFSYCFFWILYLLWLFAIIELNGINFADKSMAAKDAQAGIVVLSIMALFGAGAVVALGVYVVHATFNPSLYAHDVLTVE